MGPKLEGFARKILPLHRGRLAADEDFSFFGFNEVRVVRPTDDRHRSRTTATEQRQRRQEEALLGRLLACIHLSCGARAFDLSPRFVHCFTGRHRCHHPCPPRRRATASPPLSIKHFTSLRHVARTVGGGNCPPLPPSLPTSPRSVFTDIRSEWSGGRREEGGIAPPSTSSRRTPARTLSRSLLFSLCSVYPVIRNHLFHKKLPSSLAPRVELARGRGRDQRRVPLPVYAPIAIVPRRRPRGSRFK